RASSGSGFVCLHRGLSVARRGTSRGIIDRRTRRRKYPRGSLRRTLRPMRAYCALERYRTGSTGMAREWITRATRLHPDTLVDRAAAPGLAPGWPAGGPEDRMRI